MSSGKQTNKQTTRLTDQRVVVCLVANRCLIQQALPHWRSHPVMDTLTR
jgi:hypothetical protein